MYTWMHDIRIPIAAIDKFEKEMKNGVLQSLTKPLLGKNIKGFLM